MNISHLPSRLKKDALSFYKSQRYSASFMGYDTCYAAHIDEQMIACVILSDIGKIEDKKAQAPLFLHALVVDKNFRNKGVASNLLSHVNSLHKSTICFASNELKQLYFSNEFTMVQPDGLTEPFKSRYMNYKNKQPDLFIFHRETD